MAGKFHKYLMGVFIAFMVLGGALNIRHIEMPKGYSILNGDLTAKITTDYNQSFSLRNHSIQFWNTINGTIFNEGKTGVLIGDKSWLFTTEEFQHPDNFNQNIQHNLDYIRTTIEAFQRDNIEVTVIPVPAKSRVYQDKLDRYSYPDYWIPIYNDFIQFLETKDIKYVDTLSLFQKNGSDTLYFKTDTHWTPAATQLISGHLSIHSKTPKFQFTQAGQKEFMGDLSQYTVFDEPEKYDVWQTNAVNPRQDLFGDQYFPVILIGTSYSADPKWHFEGFLKQALNADILNLADEGQGSFQVMQDYLENFYTQNKKPKKIIWEIPERYLPVNMKD